MGDVQTYVPRHVQPPVTLGNELQGFEAAWVSSHLGVMTERNYAVAEVRGILALQSFAVSFRIKGSSYLFFTVMAFSAQ